MDFIVALFLLVAEFTTSRSVGFVISATITAVHTFDECASLGGPIWRYLGKIVGWNDSVSDGLLAPGYFAFQTMNLWLAWTGLVCEESWAVAALLAIRLTDLGMTHTVLPMWWSPNPGESSRWLLLFDVGIILLLLWW